MSTTQRLTYHRAVHGPRHVLRWLSVALAVILTAALLIATPPAFAEGVSGEVLVGPRSTNANGDGIRTPDIVATSATNAVTVWREGTTVGTHDSGSLLYSYTTDGGATWSTPAYMKQRNATYSYHWVILYEVGSDVYAFIGRAPASSTNGNPATPIMMKSTNGGQTWADFTVTFPAMPANNLVVAGRPLLDGTTHIVPVWYSDASGEIQSRVIRSTNMTTWTSGADVAWTPTGDGGIDPGEPMISLSQDDPGTLVIVARVSRSGTYYDDNAAYSYVSTSDDGGLTWTQQFEPEPNIPNYNTKTYFTKSSTGSYLAIYNTFGGTFSGPAAGRPDEYRGTLYYSVKKPGQDWSSGRFFADGPAVLTARSSSDGWDTYPMADEYEPGKFFVVWEHDTSVIKFAKLDITDAFTNMDHDWSALAPYTSTLNGGSVTVASGTVTLSNDDSTDTSVIHAEAPGTGFIASFSGKLTDTATLNTTTGVGVNMGLEVRNGTRGLMLTVQSDGVYAKVSGSATWQKVLNQAIDSANHQYRVVVSAAGVARLFMDSLDTGAQWTIPTDAGSKRARVWVSGSAADAAASQVDWTLVEENVVSSVFDDLTGWSTFTSGGTATSTGGKLTMTSTGVGLNGAGQNPAKFCAFTVDLRGAVTNYAPLNTTTGEGSNLAIKVQNGAYRLMLTIQTDGVYVLPRGATTWTRVYTLANAGALASWRIDTNSSGLAHLYRNGTDTGATWILQALDDAAAVTMWTSGRSGDASASEVDWLRTTCNSRVPTSEI